MHYSKILTCAAVAVASALVLVQASQYGNNYARPQGGQYSAAQSHNPGAGCQGYSCNRPASMSPYGPYHSYAVRPVVYGGHGMYHYKGYARHPPAPRQYKQRYARSYGSTPRRYPAPASGCRGRYCGAPTRQYSQPARQYSQQSYQSMRPVKAVALVPASNYQARPAYPPKQQQYGGYRSAPTYGSSRGSTYGSNHYGAANNNAHQQRYNGGGYQKASYGNGY